MHEGKPPRLGVPCAGTPISMRPLEPERPRERTITAVEEIELKYNLLTFRVHTDRGPTWFVMRNSHSQAQDFGPAGKLLIDVDDNRYLVRDVTALPRRQQTLFRRYIYW